MAQLIKLQDYVSRYEKDMIRYPSQFVRLKMQQWTKIKQQWEDGSVFMNEEEVKQFKEDVEGKQGLIKRFKKIWVKEDQEQHPKEYEEVINEESLDEQDPSFEFEPQVYYRPETLDDLKHIYIDQLFQFQLQWASSTLSEKSYVDSKYGREESLRFFMQRFPDTYLVMYQPIMLLKKAPIELDVLLFTPTNVWCITLIEGAEQAAYIGTMDRFWTVKTGNQEKRMLNPTIALNRTETIIKQIFNKHQIDFPVKKAVLSRNGYIDFPDAPYGLTILDKKSFPEWFTQQRNTRSPLKAMQLKAAQAIIDETQTTAVRRMQWTADEEDPSILPETYE